MELPINYANTHWSVRRLAREQYVLEQEGLCYHCKQPLDGESGCISTVVNPKLFPEGFFNYPVHLHHDHFTDKTIGAVHCHCNAVLWEHHGV